MRKYGISKRDLTLMSVTPIFNRSMPQESKISLETVMSVRYVWKPNTNIFDGLKTEGFSRYSNFSIS
jgi:hypothetical protein